MSELHKISLSLHRERGSAWKHLLDRWLGIPLLCIAALWRMLERRLSKTAHLNEPREIGVLCLGAIGDMLLASCLFKALHTRWPQARITLFTSRANARAAFLTPFVSENKTFEVTDILGLLRQARAAHFDLFVDTGQWARLGALVCALSGAGTTAGFRTPGQCRHLAFEQTAEHRGDRHELLNFQALGQCVTGLSTVEAPTLCAPAPAMHEAVAAFAKGRPLVACHPFPSGIHARLKEWPEEHWIALTETLTAHGICVLFTGSPADTERILPLLDRMTPATRRCVLCIAGMFSFRDEVALLQKLDAFISVNTGTMHLSALLGTPTIDLHGPTNPARWGGLGSHVIHLQPLNGNCAYLHLGFEYPSDADTVLRHLPPENVVSALQQCGEPFADLLKDDPVYAENSLLSCNTTYIQSQNMCRVAS